jgi:hypothetical protein
MKTLRLLIVATVSLAGAHVQAQNAIADLGGSTTREKNTYAVYDLRGAGIDAGAIQKVVLDAIRLYARDAQVREGIVPQPYPDYPNQMTIGRRLSGGPKPDCAGEVFSVEGIDLSMARYGEKTYHRVCLFPYSGGYRINYYAIYSQQSGAGNANPNVLSAMLGRAMGSVVGLGDSSTSINKILGRMESGLQSAGVGFRLIQLQPAGMPDRIVVEDDLQRPSVQVAATPPPATTPMVAEAMIAPAAPAGAVAPGQQMDSRNVPPALAQLQAALAQQREATRQQMAAQLPSPGLPRALNPAEARKELTSMGLQYYSQDQFLAAIRRGDTLAVDLFVSGAGIDLNAGAPGATPLAIAESSGRQEIAVALKAKGAR